MSELLRVGFCVSGEGRLFQQAVRYRGALGIEPAFVVIGPTANPALPAWCERSEILHERVGAKRAERDHAIDRKIRETDAGLVVLTFDHIVGPELVAAHRGRLINVHPGLLPAFPGPKAIERAAESGVRFAGATMHVVTDEVDGGPVIAQCVIPTIPGERSDGLGARLWPQLRAMYLQVLRWYAEGRVTTDPRGHVTVRGARYDGSPISPIPEAAFPE